MDNDAKKRADCSENLTLGLNYEQKLNVAMVLYWSSRELKGAFYRQQYPGWTEIKIQQAVKEWMLYGNPLNVEP